MIKWKRWLFLLSLAVISATPSLAMGQAGAPTLPPDLSVLTGPESPLVSGDRIVFLGDSITYNGSAPNGFVTLIWNALHSRKDADIQAINAGIPGNRVPDIQERLDRDVLGFAPTVVFLYIGTNDVWHWETNAGTTKADYEAGLRDIIGRLRARGITVILATPGVIGEKTSGNKFDDMLSQYSGISRKVAADFGVQVCDLHRVFLDYLASHNPGNQAQGILTVDQVHLSELGNDLVADEATKSIAAALEAEPMVPHIPVRDFFRTFDTRIIIHSPHPATGTVIRYTTDGSPPNANSPASTGALTLSSTTTIHARTVVNDRPASPVVTATCKLIPPSAPVDAVVVPGLIREFIPGLGAGSPDLSTLTPTQTIVVPNLSFANLPSEENYAVVFKGYFKAPDTGFYDFGIWAWTHVEADVDHQLINRFNGGGPNQPLTRLALQAGLHPVEIRFYSPGKTGETITWSVRGPDNNRQAVPDQDWFH